MFISPVCSVFQRNIIEESPGRPPTMYFLTINYFISVEEGGVAAEPLESEKVSQLCITKEEALALGHLGMQLEQMFGGPRDIEWALSKVSDTVMFSR
jgi:hypothetical protein